MVVFSPGDAIGITALIIKDLNSLIRTFLNASTRFRRARQLYLSLAETAQDCCDDVHEISSLLHRMREQGLPGRRAARRVRKKLSNIGDEVREAADHANAMLARGDVMQRLRAGFGRKLREMEAQLREVRAELRNIETKICVYQLSNFEKSMEDVRTSIELQRTSLDETRQRIEDVNTSMENLNESFRSVQLVPRRPGSDFSRAVVATRPRDDDTDIITVEEDAEGSRRQRYLEDRPRRYITCDDRHYHLEVEAPRREQRCIEDKSRKYIADDDHGHDYYGHVEEAIVPARELRRKSSRRSLFLGVAAGAVALAAVMGRRSHHRR